ncbi:unnamed protein product [Rhodiola kirilowii]
MNRALGIKAKLGFIQGHFAKPMDDPYKLTRWERCNSVILTWIINSISDEIGASLVHSTSCIQAWMNLQKRFGGDNTMREYSISKEISLLMQGDLSVSTYFSKLLQLWGYEDSYENDTLCELGEKCKSTACMNDKKLKTKIQKFLMGLNDIHVAVRTQILATRPKPGLDEIYSLVIDDEDQKRITKPTVVEASVLYISFNNQNDRQHNNQNDRQYNSYADRQSNGNRSGTATSANSRNRKPMVCTHYQIQGHLKESCYKLNGYPPGHRLHRGNTSQNYHNNRPMTNNVTVISQHSGNMSTNNADKVLLQGLICLQLVKCLKFRSN